MSFIAGLVLLLTSTPLAAQYNLVPIAPPPNFSFNDLWHFNIFNSDSANTVQYYVSLRIFDGSDILKVKSNTSVISIGPGSNYYNLGNISLLQPFTTSYYDASILQQTISSGGLFPPGTYHLVYTLYGKFADGSFTPLTEDASEAVVEAMWPPMLLSPPDGDTIDTQYPLLTWTPAFSSAYVGQISYTLNLVELFPGQNVYQAIQANPLYFTQNNIPITILPYPPGAQLLDTSKTYAWQVHADAMGAPMGSSEVWTFTFGKHSIPVPEIVNKPFLEASRTLTSYYSEITDGLLRISFEEKLYDDDGLLTFEISNNLNEVVATQAQLDKNIVSGFNKIRISLCNNSTGFNLPRGHYKIKIVSQRGDAYYLNFYHNKNMEGCSEE